MSETQQQFIQGILDKVYPNLNDPNNSFYVPKYVISSHLDPYNPPQGSTWTMQNVQEEALLNELPGVCFDIKMGASPDPCANQGSSNDHYNAVPKRGPDITLSNIVVTGASNAYVPSATAISQDGFTIQIQLNFSTLANYPKPVSVTGNFSLTLYCCCGPSAKAGGGCSDPNTAGNPSTGSGTFTATINNSSAIATIQITDLQEGTLNLIVKSIEYKAALSDMTVTPTITSIPNNAQSYNGLVTEAFSADATLQYVLQQVNVQLNRQSALDQMGTVLQNELDGYLKAYHQYPFDQSGSAAF